MNRTLKSGGILNRLAKPVDLINGTPWRSILIYAVPIMLSYLLQQIYILTDSIICGQVLTSGEVAGINDTFALTFIFLQFAFGCTAGFSVVTAKCVGSKDSQGTRRSFTAQVCLFGGDIGGTDRLVAAAFAVDAWRYQCHARKCGGL